ncbi:polysaccharide deacetylase family protein [Salirhabdus sp. Marseille-P4669]|uniref:polysaccharide deacetylase family protein n=1 Tax=Salirhabdus sp. Marseille-P4669 TaxID=2042310 RepID=UPI000C7C17F1|nr:polysaccharide deacetylase family protein [Salirhabdus sp. Marseille-P4669]
MKSNGILVISLDFELNWGVFDVFPLEDYEKNIKGAREAIPFILKEFQKHNIHATWGIVGFLFFSNKQELVNAVPEVKPTYINKSLSAYSHIENIGDNEEEDPFHYGASLIRALRTYPNQEIATHTFSHYYCLAEGQSELQFEADIACAVKTAEKNGFDTNSIIFPRNQQNPAYASICEKYGIHAYRGNEEHWIYNQTPKQGLIQRALRLIDSYVNLTGRHIYDIATLPHSSNLVTIPSSRFLRPYTRKLKWLEPLKVKRIKQEMTEAAREGKMYHLWWHPHNFGYPLKENMHILQQIIAHYKALKDQFGMESCTMHEVYKKWHQQTHK